MSGRTCHVDEAAYSQHACVHCERTGGTFGVGPGQCGARLHGLPKPHVWRSAILTSVREERVLLTGDSGQ
eukprot:3026594-Prymnesium_polylepis.1